MERSMPSLKSMPLAASIMAFSLAAQPALAGDVVINLGYAAAEGSSYAVLADKFEELAEEYSGGSIDVKVRCCGQLMGEDEAFKAMQLGTVDMHVITGNNISPHFPLMDAFVLPYIFEDKAHAYRVLEGEVGQNFAGQLHEATGVHLLTFGFVGDRDFYNSRNPDHQDGGYGRPQGACAQEPGDDRHLQRIRRCTDPAALGRHADRAANRNCRRGGQRYLLYQVAEIL